MMSVNTKYIEFHHISTANERKYICLCRMLKENMVTIVVTDGDSLYTTRTHSEGWKKTWSDFASATIVVTDDSFVAKMPGNAEYILRSVKGEEKTNEMFSLIATLAENQGKSISKEPQQSVISTLSNNFPSSKTQSSKVKKMKGSSILGPSKKKRKPATGVIYE